MKKKLSKVLASLSLCTITYVAVGSLAISHMLDTTPDELPNSVSTYSWTGAVNDFDSPGKVKAFDDQYAWVPAGNRTYKLYASDFGFDSLIGNADQINGIRVSFTGYSSPAVLPEEQTPVYGGFTNLVDDSAAEVSGASKAIVSNPFLPETGGPPNADGLRNLGGGTDLWGQSAGFWDGKVTDPDFGFTFFLNYNNVNAVLYFNAVTMRIWYTEATTGKHKSVERTSRLVLK